MRVTAFTCVFGETDSLRTPTVVNPRVRYVVLSDRIHDVPPYDCVLVSDPELFGPRLLSRQVKILADHPALGEPDVTLWHDAAYQLCCDPVEVAEDLLSGVAMIAFRHPHRDRIEDEARAIASHGYAKLSTLNRQVIYYRKKGFRHKTSITSTGFCLRRKDDPRVRSFNQTWWHEVKRWCWRDQMSVDYALWKNALVPAYIPGHYRDNPYALWYTTHGVPVRDIKLTERLYRGLRLWYDSPCDAKLIRRLRAELKHADFTNRDLRSAGRSCAVRAVDSAADGSA